MRTPTESIALASSRWIADGFAEICPSASCYGAPKDVFVVPIVESESELIEIQRKIFLAHVVVGADDSALQQRPESLNRVRVNDAAHILIFAVTDEIVRATAVRHRVVTAMLIGNYQLDAAGDGFVHESHHSVAIRLFNHFADDVALAGNRADYDGLSEPRCVVRITFAEMFVLYLFRR